MPKDSLPPAPADNAPDYYELRIKGHLMPFWSEAFEGMQFTLMPGGETLIAGAIADQAALHGLLARIRDLNLTLLSVTWVKPGQP